MIYSYSLCTRLVQQILIPISTLCLGVTLASAQYSAIDQSRAFQEQMAQQRAAQQAEAASRRETAQQAAAAHMTHVQDFANAINQAGKTAAATYVANRQADRERQDRSDELQATFNDQTRQIQAARLDARAAAQESSVSTSTDETISAPAPSAERYAGERYPQTRAQLLTEEEAAGMTYAQVRYAINEVYARHGASFPKNPAIRASFTRFDWYRPSPDTSNAEVEGTFSNLERANIETLAKYRDLKKR